MKKQDREFMLAVKRGNGVLAETLIANPEVNVNCARESGWTCLHFAVQRNDVNIIKLLVARGAYVNPDLSKSIWPPPLLYAIILGQEDAAKLLIELGADVNVKLETAEYMTPLDIALNLREFSLAELLIDSGADVPLTPCFDKSTLWKALIYEAPASLISKIIDRGDRSQLTITDALGVSYLYLALSRSSKDVVKIMMDQPEIDPMWKSRGGMTTLYYYALRAFVDDPEIVIWLLEKDVDLNATTTGNCKTALHAALESGNTNIAMALIDMGADINARTSTGETPLHFATKTCSKEMMECLLSMGANLHCRNSSGSTPLHQACSDESEGSIRALLLNGADALAVDNFGRTPLQLITNHQSLAAKQMIRYLAGRESTRMQSIPFELGDYYRECLAVIEEMKRIHIYGNVTLYYVFSMKEDRLAKLLNNDEFVNSYIEKLFFDQIFPTLYMDYITSKYKRALEKMKRYRKIKKHLEEVFKYRFPDEILDHMVDYFKIDDLVN